MEAQAGREPGFKGMLKHLWAEGLARKFVVDREGSNIARVPLSIVIIGAIVAPWLAAAGVVLAVVTGCRIAVERDGETPALAPEPPEPLSATPPDASPEDAQ